MDLKIKDVAELLNVSETTIRRWLLDGKIPAYRLNHQYRFNRQEIEHWLINHKLGKVHSNLVSYQDDSKSLAEPHEISEKRSLGGRKQFNLYRAIHKGGVFYDVPGNTKEELIRATMKLVANDLNLDAEAVGEMLLEREQMQSTAVNNGIAIPHTRDFLLNNHLDAVCVVFPKKPLPYDALDGKPVHTLFFLFASDGKRHLHLLAKIAHLSSHTETLAFFQTKPDKNELFERVKNWEANMKSES